MLKNYLKVAIRNLLRNKVHSFINVFGLAIALTTCILIFLFVQDELTFDSFHSKADNIYRVVESRVGDDNLIRQFPFTTGPLAAALQNDFPVADNYVRMIPRNFTGRFTIEYGDKKFYEGNHFFAEPSFFTVFDFELIEGNRSSALAEPNTVILTETTAEKYFGNENPVGKVLSVERIGDMKITGIFKGLPGNSHLDFNMIFSFSTLQANEGWRKWMENWKSDGFLTYLVLKEGTDYKQFEKNFEAFSRKYQGDEVWKERKFHLQPLRDIHFYSAGIEDDINHDAGNIDYVYIFSAAAIFILLIACINFVNLTTVKSTRRAKEVGMRKVMGANRYDLVKQFLGESIVLTILSFLVSAILVELLIPSFNGLTGKNISHYYLQNFGLLAALFLIIFLAALISGSYPAFILSKFQPAQVLKGNIKSGFKTPVLRRVLVVLQFSLSIIIITATVIAYNQLQFIQNKPLGFSKEQKVIVDINSGDTRKNFQSIKHEFVKSSDVISVAASSRVPGDWKGISQVDVVPEGTSGDKTTMMYFYAFDEDVLSTYDFKLLSGRNFSAAMGTDSTALLINETAAKVLGWANPLGKKIDIPDGNFTGRIIGVVKDFHFQSLHQKIEPVIIAYRHNPIEPIDYFTIKIKTADIASTLAHLQKVHEQFDKRTPFEYNFLDERINDFYLKDQRTAKLFGIAAAFAILIACLGLFGLASYTTELRTKEIGIRKVLGASIAGILNLISREFIVLVLAANLAALPVSYWFINKWLEEFAYRIEIEISTYLFTGIATILISILTVSFMAFKAAAANPAKVLKVE